MVAKASSILPTSIGTSSGAPIAQLSPTQHSTPFATPASISTCSSYWLPSAPTAATITSLAHATTALATTAAGHPSIPPTSTP